MLKVSGCQSLVLADTDCILSDVIIRIVFSIYSHRVLPDEDISETWISSGKSDGWRHEGLQVWPRFASFSPGNNLLDIIMHSIRIDLKKDFRHRKAVIDRYRVAFPDLQRRYLLIRCAML